MSKKNRLKKKNKQKIQKKIDQFIPSEEIEVAGDESAVETIANKKIELQESDTIIDETGRKFISKDVRMIIFTLAGLVLILTGVKYLELKTSYINNLGDWLYKITNIQTM